MDKAEKVYLDYANDKDLNPSEENILLFLIRSKFENKTLSIRKAANELFVSTTSIIRLCKKLGFSGYSEFSYHLALKVKRSLSLDSEAGTVEGIDLPLDTAVSEFIENYQATLDAIDQASIQELLDELKRHSMIYFYGAGFSTLFSNYMAKRLELFGYYVSNSTTSDSRAIFFNNIQKYSLLIIFSRSGETEKVMEKVEIAKEEGLKTILFTGNPDSTTAQMADIVFTVLDPTIESQQEFQITSYESNMFMLIDLILSLAVKRGIIAEY